MENKVYRGEIYYIYETEVTGNEQAGGRPGIIISNDVGNEHSPVAIVVYLTTREKKPLPTHVKINSAEKPSTALCEQIETVYKGRIGKYIGQITDTEQKNLDKALAVSIGIGLNLKGTKFVETWSKMYSEEVPQTTMTDALKKVIPDIEEQEKKAEENHTPEEIVRLETERDVYRGMYNELLSFFTEGNRRIRA
ncbi:MAG: type II toxin-antitoxin system PemK/MazF family toxin [Lachnospiraceae bacterium]|jgi:mRNA-degrading endonuclease toxin of MazEF toxin-antitoxin module